MNAYRNKPDIGKTDTWRPQKSGDDPMGCVWSLLFIVVSYFVFSAITRVTSGSGSKLDQLICYGALVCFVIIVLVGTRGLHEENKARKAERIKWAKSCKTALMTIVNRREASSWWDDYSYRYMNSPNRLELEMNSDQKAVRRNETIVTVEVSQYVYERLKACGTVRIYYMPESPMAFLLEEEL